MASELLSSELLRQAETLINLSPIFPWKDCKSQSQTPREARDSYSLFKDLLLFVIHLEIY